MTELEITSAEQIVRALVAREWPRNHPCPFCYAWAADPKDIDHEDRCPWQLALEWAAADGSAATGGAWSETPGTPTDFCTPVAATRTAWDTFCADAWTDDWVDLCEALGIDYSGAELNSRALRKCVIAWAWANVTGWNQVQAYVGMPAVSPSYGYVIPD